MNKILVDTNVLIYSIDEESKYFKRSQNLILDNTSELFTTSKNISEFLAVVTRFPRNSLKISQALEVVIDFKNIFSILYPSNRSLELFMKLLNKYKPTGLKIHDFEIISIGLAHRIEKLATLNRKDFEEVNEIKLHSF